MMRRKICILLDHTNHKVGQSSLEALALGQAMAGKMDATVEALVLCSRPEAVSPQLEEIETHATILLTDASLQDYDPDLYCHALESHLSQEPPDVLLMAHTYQNIDFAPKLAARLGVGLATDCVGFRWEEERLILVRPMFRNKLNADIVLQSSPPIMATVQAGAAGLDQLQRGPASLQSRPCPVDASLRRRRQLETIESGRGKVDLNKAEVVVGVGRGIKKAENLHLIEALAEALGAEIGASRPVVDNDWLERARQIGSSGQNVTPRLYVACGISGAIQHVVGMKGSGCIVAINTDRNAPIFNVAHYGIVGDLFEIVPALTRLIQEQR